MIHSPLGTADEEQEIDDDSAAIPESIRTTATERTRDGTLALGIGGIALAQGVRTLRSDRNGSGTNLLLGGAFVAIGLTQRRHRLERASSVTGSGTPDAEEIEEESLERERDGPGRGEGAGPFPDGERDEEEIGVDRRATDVGSDDSARDELEFDADDALETERDDDTREATTDVLDQIDDDVPVDENRSDATESRAGPSVGEGPSREDEGKEAIGKGMTGEDDQEPMADDAIGRVEGEDDVGGGEREEVEDPARMEDLAEDLEDAEDENGDA